MQKIELKFNPIKKLTTILDASGKDITALFCQRYNYTEFSINNFSNILNSKFFENLNMYCNNGVMEKLTILFSGILSHYDALVKGVNKWYNDIITIEKHNVYEKKLSEEIENYLKNGNFRFDNIKSLDTVGNLCNTAIDDIISLKNDDGFNIFVLGSTNSGKSAYVNSLIGSDILPVSSSSCTSISYKIIKSLNKTISFSVANMGEIFIDCDNDFELKTANNSSTASLLASVIENCKKALNNQDLESETKKDRIITSIISFINYLPKSQNECDLFSSKTSKGDMVYECLEHQLASAPSILSGEYVDSIEIKIEFPIKLMVGNNEKLTINDNPGHTHAGNDGEHLKKLELALKADTANTILMFVTRPDNPATVDNANLIDSINALNKSIDPEYSFFIVSHADTIGQNKIDLNTGEILSKQERLLQFDKLINANSIKCKSCNILFTERNVFFVDSYKSLLVNKYPNLIDDNGYIEYELHTTKENKKEVSLNYLPYYEKNRVGTGQLYSQEIVDSCQEILNNSEDKLEKARVRTGILAVQMALGKYLELNYDVIKAKKLYDGARYKAIEISNEITKQLIINKSNYSQQESIYAVKKREITTEIRLLLSQEQIVFKGGTAFKEIEQPIAENCLALLEEKTVGFNGIDKEQFIDLYNRHHPDCNLLSLKGITKDDLQKLKEEVKNDIISSELNNLYLNTIIHDFFSSPSLSNAVKDYKKSKLTDIFNSISKNPMFNGISNCSMDYITDVYTGDISSRAKDLLVEKEVTLEWNSFTRMEKFKNTLVGIFKPKEKKYITEKLEVNKDTQMNKINSNWEKVEDSLNTAIQENFISCEYELFLNEITSDSVIETIDALSQIKAQISAYKSIIDNLEADKEQLDSILLEIEKIYNDV